MEQSQPSDSASADVAQKGPRFVARHGEVPEDDGFEQNDPKKHQTLYRPGDSSRALFIPTVGGHLTHLKGSRFNHPKKGTLNHQGYDFSHIYQAFWRSRWPALGFSLLETPSPKHE